MVVQTLDDMIAELEVKDIDVQLDKEEEARILLDAGLDEDLEPVTPQHPDWLRMCDL